MSKKTCVLVPCTVSAGGFGSERTILIGGYKSCASEEYVLDWHGDPIGQLERGHGMKGFVQAIVLERKEGQVLVNLATGDNLWLGEGEVIPHPGYKPPYCLFRLLPDGEMTTGPYATLALAREALTRCRSQYPDRVYQLRDVNNKVVAAQPPLVKGNANHAE